MSSWAERVAVAEAGRACGHYGGCGCDAHKGCCAECPFPDCIHDAPFYRNRKRAGNLLRDTQMRGLRRGGMPVRDIADRFSLSARNTFRILAEHDMST